MITSFKRILFPVDFSEHNAAATLPVRSMAERFGSEVILLHVVGLPVVMYGSPEGAAWAALISADRLRAEGRIALDRFAAQYFPKTKVTIDLDEGDTANSIASYAIERNADLIMMPTRGYGPFRSLLLGSVTAKVLHDVACPVWTGVHSDQLTAHPADRWKRMLCAIDSDRKDLGLLRWAANFAAEQNVQLRLVHAVLGAGAAANNDADPGMHDFLFDVAKERIAQMQSEAGTRFDVCFLAGPAGRAVHQSAIGHDADLVIIGRGIMHKTLGRLRSNTYSIIREAPCPVLSI